MGTNAGVIWSVAFHSDGMQLLSGNDDGVRRWRVAGGQEVGSQMGMNGAAAISVSRDGKWIVCGTMKGAGVWDAEMQEEAIEVEGTDVVRAVDISPESTRFATGAGEYASTWNIITGGRLVGPLQHDSLITGIKFSPNGEHIATAVRGRFICVFDSRNGDQLIIIKANISPWSPLTPLAWSNDGQQLFAACSDRKIKSFDVSTGSKLAELQVHGNGQVVSIALATNGKFLATFARRSITFWDTSTFTQIGPVIENSRGIRSIALSPDCSYLATGGIRGNITIRSLNHILPDLYGPFGVSICALTILPDKSHNVFPLLLSPLGTYARRSWIGKTKRCVTTTSREAWGLRSPRQQSTRLDSCRSLSACNRKSHTDSLILRTNPQRQVHLLRKPTAKPVVMAHSR